MVASGIFGALAALSASAQASEVSAAGEVLSLLQTQVHKHNSTIVVEDPADVEDPANENFPGYDFHEFSQSLCSKYGEHFPKTNKAVVLKCPTKVIPSNVNIFNNDLKAYGGCAGGTPYSWSWKARVDQGHKNGVGRGDYITKGDGPQTEAVTEACRLAAEKDVRCAGANVYAVQSGFCDCYGGVVALQPKDGGYYRWASPFLTCNLKSLPSIQNPMVKTANNDGAEKEVYSIKETSSLQGCSKGWYSLNGGGNDYDGGRIPRVGYGDRDFDKLGGVYLIEGGRYDIQRPSDCVERIASIKRNDAGSNPQDVTSCENAVGASMLPAGSSAVGKPQRECACLLTDDLSAYRATGPAEFGGTAGGLGSWVCLLDDGDSTKGEMFLPVPKKSGVYKADGPSAEKPKLSPEEKAKCKADRSRLKAAKKEKKEAKKAFKALQDEVKQLKADMENC